MSNWLDWVVTIAMSICVLAYLYASIELAKIIHNNRRNKIGEPFTSEQRKLLEMPKRSGR